MKGVIILKQADFSANNIGRYVEFSDLTKNVLTKQTQYSVDSNEAIALNIMLADLKEGGYIGGNNPLLKVLFLPCLAKEHSEMMYNIANLSDGYPVNEMSDSEKNAAESQQAYKPVYDGGKIIGMKAYQTSETSDPDIKRAFNSHVFNRGEEQKLNSFSYVSYHLNPVPGWTHNFFATLHPSGTSVLFNGNTAEGGYLKAAYSSDTIMRAELVGNLKGFVGISYRSEDKFYGVIDNGTLGESVYNAAAMDKNPDNYVVINAANNESTHMATSVFALGEYMTIAQLSNLRTIIKEFLTALNIM